MTHIKTFNIKEKFVYFLYDEHNDTYNVLSYSHGIYTTVEYYFYEFLKIWIPASRLVGYIPSLISNDIKIEYSDSDQDDILIIEVHNKIYKRLKKIGTIG